MKVQHICRRFVRDSWGGTESAVISMSRGLLDHGHQVEILTSQALDPREREVMDAVPVRRFSHFYPYLGLSPAARHQMDLRAGNLFSFSLLRHLLVAPPPDVFHLHTGKRMGGIVRTAARFHRRPYVVSLHGGALEVPADERQRWTAPAQGSFEWGRLLGAAVGARRVLDDADAILCVNRDEQRALQSAMPTKRIYWTPNSLDTQRFRRGDGRRFRAAHAIPADAPILLNVGRIDEQKNQLHTLDVFDRLAPHFPHLWLVLVGAATNPDYAHRLRLRIAQPSAPGRVLCLGNIAAASPDLVDIYNAADLFLMSSVHEPFGIVLLEAWAAGVPVVAPRIGGVPSFVDDRQTGMLYPVGDVDAAASLAHTVLADAARAASLRSSASQAVARFDTRHATASLIAIYEEVCRERALCA